MALSSPGIGSNLDVNGIVSQLMALERQPLTSLSKKEAGIQAKLSAIGNLKSALSTFQTAVQGLSSPSKFQSVRVSSGDSNIVTASGSGKAEPGTHTLEVTKLAQAQKLVAQGQAATSTAIGNGTITIDFGTIALGESGSFDSATGKYTGASFASSGSGTKTIEITAGNNSLAGIRDAINSANVGVTASIVNDGGSTPHRLVLTQQSTGKTSSMKISVDGDAALKNLLEHDPAGTQALKETTTAQNAEFTIDGLAISKATNSVSDVLDGVSLTLKKTNAGEPTTITVTRDTSAVSTAVNQFVTAYNQVHQTLANLTSYNAETKQAAALTGDSTARGIQTQMRALLTTEVAGAGAYKLLNDIGVTLQKDGKLGVDKDKLDKAIGQNFEDIANLFAAAGKATDSLVSYADAGTKTVPGSYDIEVTQLATQARTVGSAPPNLTIDASNDTLIVKLDGTTATIKLAHATYSSAAMLAAEVQTRINGVADFKDAGSTVTVTTSGGALTLLSERYGSASEILVSGGNGLASLLGASPASTNGSNVAGKIGGVAAIGSGRFLTGADGTNMEGLKIEITGGVLGNRGTVRYANGYARQFDKLVESWLANDGLIRARVDGYNASLENLSDQRDRLNLRMESIEKRYRAQFSALDVMLSNMTRTSDYLAQQLANLPKIG